MTSLAEDEAAVDNRRRVQTLLSLAANPGPDPDFTDLARAEETTILLEALSNMSSTGTFRDLLAARREALSAIIQQRLSSAQIATMKQLSCVGTCLTVVAIILAFVQAAAAAVALYTFFKSTHLGGIQ